MATPPFILAKSTLEAHKFARENLGLAKGHYRPVTSPSSISGRRNADIYLVPGWEKRHDRFAMRGALKYSRLKQIHVSESFHEQAKRPLDADFAAFAARMNEMMESLPPLDPKASDAQWLRNLARERGTLSIGYVEGDLSLSRDEYAAILTEEGFFVDEDDPDNFVHPQRKADFLSGAYRDDVPSNGDEMVSEGSPVSLSAEEIAEIESHLEPEGFELSDDPGVQAMQILESAARSHKEDSEQTGTTEPSEDAASDEAPKRRRRRCKDCGTLHFKEQACPDLEE